MVTTKPTLFTRYKTLSNTIASSNDYEVICVNDFAPVESWEKYKYIKELVVPARIVLFRCSDGKMNIVFL